MNDQRRTAGMAKEMIALGLAVLPLTACGPDRSDQVIVESTLAPAEWNLEEVLSIGELEGADPYVFEYVSRVRFIGDSLLAVVPGTGDGRIRLFSLLGQYLRSVGGQGDGPAEVRYLGDILVGGGGELVLEDSGRGRILVLSTEGRSLREFRIRDPSLDLENGGWALTEEGILALSHPRPHDTRSGPERQQDSVRLIHQTEGGEAITLRRIPGRATIVKREEGGLSLYFAPLEVGPRLTDWRNGGALLEGEVGTVHLLDNQGQVVRSVRSSREAAPVTSQVISSWIEERRKAFSGLPKPPGLTFESIMYPFAVEPEWPERLPIYDLILPIKDQCIWVRRYHLLGSDTKDWDILHVDQGLIATTSVSAEIDLQSVGPDGLVAARSRDSFGVTRVKLLRVLGEEYRRCEGDGSEGG